MALLRKAVTSNTTGSVYRYGRTDFTGQFNPVDFSQVTVNEDTEFTDGVETYYHKVVSGDLVEMNTAEKAAVDTEREEMDDEKLAGAARIGKKYAQLSDLPVPPPGAGYLVAIENVGGSWGFAYSTNTGYIIFQASGTYP